MGQIRTEMRAIGDIHPYELNAKVHNDVQVDRIAKSIREFGFDQPIVVDKDGVVIKGHGRRLAAIKLGFKEVLVVVREDLNDEEVRAARLADNRVALGDIDSDLLQRELASLNYNLEGIFDKKELDFLDADLSEMNLDNVVFDLEAEVGGQSEETIKKIEETDERPVRIDKVLGFKEIKGKDERVVARFMAFAEDHTKLEGAEAFVTFVEYLNKTAA